MLSVIFCRLAMCDDQEEIAKTIKAELRKEAEAFTSSEFNPNRVPLDIVNGPLYGLTINCDFVVDTLVRLAVDIAKYNRDGSLKEESILDGLNEIDEALAEPTETDK